VKERILVSKQEPIKPLFTTMTYVNDLRKLAINFIADNYNKKFGEVLIKFLMSYWMH